MASESKHIKPANIPFVRRAGKFYRRKNILVSGGAGFIGSRLSKRLCDLGAVVTVVDPLDPFCGGDLFNLRPCRGEIRLIRRRIENFVRDEKLQTFSLIFNCAGLSDHHLGFQRPDVDYRVNCRSGVALLQEIAKNRLPLRMVSIGSRSQYGRGSSSISESDPLEPLDIQAAHKTALEHYHRVYGQAFGIDFVFLRLTNTYGPGQRMRGKGIGFVGEIIRESLDGNPVIIFGSLNRVKDLLYLDDVVEALLCAGMADNIRDRIFNVGAGPCRVGDLLAAIREEIPGLEVKVRNFPDGMKSLDTGDSVLNSEKFSEASGWSPAVGLEKGISSTIEYYRLHRRHYW